MIDSDLAAVMAAEIERHVATLKSEAPLSDKLRAVHSARGAAAIAGLTDLAQRLAPLEERLRNGDTTAVTEARAALLAHAADGPPKDQWPNPPTWLVVRPLHESIRADYMEEVSRHVARLQKLQDLGVAEPEIRRIVHTLKGSASIVGDEPMAWFCHGLEEHVMQGNPKTASLTLTQAIEVIGELGVDAMGTLERLRHSTNIGGERRHEMPERKPTERPPPMRAPTSLPPPELETARVPVQALDHLHTTFASFDVFEERLRESARRSADAAKELEGLRRDVQTAIGVLGPPKPWGVSERAVRTLLAAVRTISTMSDRVEDTASRLRELGADLSTTVSEGKRELGAMQRTTPKRVFSLLEGHVMREADRANADIQLAIFGDDVSIDRRLLDALSEPLMHLARNAVAHGALGRTNGATRVELGAEKAGTRVHFTIADDGPGIDSEGLLKRARELGFYREREPGAEELFELLFLPGFSTKSEADHLAGRGMGLDIARLSVQRQGGTLRIGSRNGRGFVATIDVPQDPGHFPVVWVQACDAYFGLPARHVLRIEARQSAVRPPMAHVATLLDGRIATSQFVLTLGDPDDDSRTETRSVTLGVDAVGAIESALVRPLTPIASTWGPFVGACPQSDGTLRLILDHVAIATHARVRGAA